MADASTPSRRELLQGAAAGAVALSPISNALSTPMDSPHTFLSLIRTPDLVRAFAADYSEVKLEHSQAGQWSAPKLEIETAILGDRVRVLLRSHGVVSRIHLRWHGDQRAIQKYMGDHWERSYADLEWRGEAPNRSMPWYFMAYDGRRTHGYGVMVHPKAFAFWTADSEGISLWIDVRSGGSPVDLGDRTLEAVQVVCREGHDHETPYLAAKEFCRQMCPKPRLPAKPVYGTNDWNFAYGNNSAELIAGVSQLISELSTDSDNRPFSVIDEGWAMGPYEGRFGHGPWVGNPRFGDMGAFAQRLKGMGVRPGIWFRPLTPLSNSPESWRLSRDKAYLDPTIPDVLEHVSQHIHRFVDWGYEMIKHDFTTWDVVGRWGFEMGPSPTHDGWSLHDRGKTTCEALTDLYHVIREAAGGAYLIGCNTVSHIAPGYHELQRTGDDTSGRTWNRNRRMGVNTLGFRAVQHRTFYEVDPDIVSITQAVPWHLVEQWLRLVAQSGTALFVAIDPKIVDPKHRSALKEAFAIAAKPQVTGEPLDWLDTDCPRQWKLLGMKVEFQWMSEQGPWPFSD